MVSKFYDFGERVIFSSGFGLKSVDFQGIWESFEVGKMGSFLGVIFVKIDDF